jgi:hypothetical protein
LQHWQLGCGGFCKEKKKKSSATFKQKNARSKKQLLHITHKVKK